MIVQVVRQDGQPLTGLSMANFGFSNPAVPAGAAAAVICSEAVCTANRFAALGNGLYFIFLDRATPGNWRAGTYAGTVRVTAGADHGAAIVTFTIP